jgi:type II secretory ATPase GspE/PulE/Tfp pilus assembly ATPase PilB-like protein
MTAEYLRQSLEKLDVKSASYATDFVNQVLHAAIQIQTSDIHVQPTADGIDVRWRIDGVLQQVGRFRYGEQANVVSRMKVLADLLTYRTDVPQEGRIRDGFERVEMRISTFPTLYGERAVVRLFSVENNLQKIHQLGLPDHTTSLLREMISETTGALLITGPAGSGKTTTAYACLRELAEMSHGGRSIVSLEDPVEVAVPGVSQSQVNSTAGFDLVSGLKSLLRQDPEVILIGEMRDRATAEVAIQAALTGQFVVTTFHAGSGAEAIGRLVDMAIEPYLVRSAVLGILSQRLVRRLCECATTSRAETDLLGVPVDSTRLPNGCEQCSHTGYRGRLVLSELMQIRSSAASKSILSGADTAQLQRCAVENGMQPIWQNAIDAIQRGITSTMEVRRVLGFHSSIAN